MEDQDRNSFEPYDAHHRCQALSKQRRKQCGRAASVGRQHCKFHGGASLVGPEHPRYTGKSRYLSKYLPRRLEQRLVEAQQQPDLATLRKELGLLDLRLNDLLQRLGPDTPETVRDAIWPEVYGLVHLKAKTVDVYARKAKIWRLSRSGQDRQARCIDGSSIRATRLRCQDERVNFLPSVISRF